MIYDINNNHSYHYYEIAKKKKTRRNIKFLFVNKYFLSFVTHQHVKDFKCEFTDKRLTINVKKTRLSSFEDFELQPNGTHIVRVHSFK